MKKILLILLAIVMCATSLVACVDSAPNQSSSEDDTNNSKVVSSETEEENFKHEIETEDEFFNSKAYIRLMYRVFEEYKENFSNLDSVTGYYFESLSYDPSTQSAVVQVPCVKKGEPKHMTLTMNYTYVGNLKTWVLANLEYTDTVNKSTVGNDSEFVTKYYPEIQNFAFKFFRAYVQGDENTGLELIGSAHNPCFQNFSTEKGTMDNEETFAVEFVKYDYNKDTGAGTAVVNVHMKRDDEVRYMVLTIGTKDEKTEDGKITKKCNVVNFEIQD